MRKHFTKILLGAFLVVMLLIPLMSVSALTVNNLNNSDTYILSNDVDDNLILFGGESIQVEGDVNGDLIVFGGKVRVTGNVEGSLYVFGGDVVVNNMVGKNLVAIGGAVEVDSIVVRDGLILGGRVVVKGSVGEDLNIAAGDVIIDAVVGEDVRLGAGSVKLNNTIGGDLISGTGDVTLAGVVGGDIVAGGKVDVQASSVGGNITVYGDDNSLLINPETVVLGETTIKPFERMNYNWKSNYSMSNWFVANVWAKTMFALVQSVGLVLVGLLLFKFAPVRLESTISKMNETDEFFKSVLVGFFAFPVGVMLAVLLAFSVVGWPFLKVLVLLAMLALALVTPIAGIWLGRKVLPLIGNKRKYVIALTVGVVLIQLFKVVPVFGWLFYQLLVFAVIGSLLRMQWSKYKVAQNMRYKMTK